MKMAMVLAGRLKSPVVSPPIRQPEGEALQAIKDVLRAAGMLVREAV
jgi:dihydrodipicolinate synthase/N-acetylneuraminate lyase